MCTHEKEKVKERILQLTSKAAALMAVYGTDPRLSYVWERLKHLLFALYGGQPPSSLLIELDELAGYLDSIAGDLCAKKWLAEHEAELKILKEEAEQLLEPGCPDLLDNILDMASKLFEKKKVHNRA